jgi:hypothetical protein
MSLFFGLKLTVAKHVHFTANTYIRFHLACLITFEHLIFGSRYDGSAQMLLCALLVPALRSPMLLFVFRQRCVWQPTPGAQNSRCYA